MANLKKKAYFKARLIWSILESRETTLWLTALFAFL